MPELVCRVGRLPEKYAYDGFRLERRGFLSVFSFAVSDRKRRQELMERGAAVIILPVDRANRKLYLIEQPRHSKAFVQTPSGREAVKKIMAEGPARPFEAGADKALALELPAGMIDGEEKPAQAAARELAEETGLDVAPDRLTEIKTFFTSFGGCTETITGFIADVGDGTPRVTACGDGEETIAVWKYGWDEAFELARAGRIESGPTILMLQALELGELRAKRG